MSQKTSIVLTDGASTPVARTFLPAKREGLLYTYHNRASGIMAGYDVLSCQLKLPGNGSRATNVSYKLTVPTLESISNSTVSGILPAPQLAYNCIGKLEFVFPERSTSQERKNVLTMMRDLIDEELMREACENLDATYF